MTQNGLQKVRLCRIMGCIFSQPRDDRAKKSRPNHAPKRRPIVEHKINGNAKPLGNAVKNPDTKVVDLPDEPEHFRRQHFDRNSVLRHSKKRPRKNSTASVKSSLQNTTSASLNVSHLSTNATPNGTKSVKKASITSDRDFSDSGIVTNGNLPTKKDQVIL